MALKVLLVGLNYTKEGELRQLYSSVQSIVTLQQKCIWRKWVILLQTLSSWSTKIQKLISLINHRRQEVHHRSSSNMVKKSESADHVLKNLTKMITGSQNGDRLIFLFNGRSNDGNKGLGRMDIDLDDERHRRRISATEFKEVVGVFPNGVISHH
ncbi:hypothetical protein QL285_040647 [Trifolium repens]|nr:hypothetical protein QL285_040647 [Trifolium repens]